MNATFLPLIAVGLLQAPPESTAVLELWSFWRESGAAMSASVAEGTFQRWQTRINDKVLALGPVQWDTGPGTRKKHYFALSAFGDLALRARVDAWIAEAPKDLPDWEFLPARPAIDLAGVTLRLHDGSEKPGGIEVSFDELRFAARPDPGFAKVHVTICHTAFAGLDDNERAAVFLSLDAVLGEDAVELWVGAIEDQVTCPAGSSTAEGLRTLLADFAREHDGKPHLQVGQRQSKTGEPMFMIRDFGIKPLQNLAYERHITVTFRIPEGALPKGKVADELNAVEDELTDSIAKGTLFIGHTTHPGKRIVHLRAKAGSGVANDIQAWAKTQSSWAPTVDDRADPRWEALDEL